MLEYFTNAVDGKHRRVDIHSLMIGDKVAHEMSIAGLYAALAKMGCPRITNQMAKPDLLVRYGIWLQEQAELRVQKETDVAKHQKASPPVAIAGGTLLSGDK